MQPKGVTTCVRFSSLCILTVQAVGVQKVVQEAVAHISIEEIITREQRMKCLQFATLNLRKM